LTGTITLTSTGALSTTHPVAIAIANYFEVSVDEVIALHQDGLGFGEIARAYFLARELAADGDPSNDITTVQILAMHQDGMGWGQIVATLGLPKGNSNRNLGLIMRGHNGQTVIIASPDATGDDHGPPAIPPGQAKHDDQNKDRGNGGGHGNGHGGGKKK
jgi:hypothetical protein